MTLISAQYALYAFGETNLRALVGRRLTVPSEDGVLEFSLDKYLLQQDAFVASLMLAP